MAIIKQDYGTIGGGILNPVSITSARQAAYQYVDLTVDDTKQYLLFGAVDYPGYNTNNIFYINKGVLSDVTITGNIPTTMVDTTTVRLNYNQSCSVPYNYTLVQLD